MSQYTIDDSDTTKFYSYRIKLWEKEIQVEVALDGENEIIHIFNDYKDFCPKCDTPYAHPEHNSEIVCQGCGVKWGFVGALHPHPTGDIRVEIKEAIRGKLPCHVSMWCKERGAIYHETHC